MVKEQLETKEVEVTEEESTTDNSESIKAKVEATLEDVQQLTVDVADQATEIETLHTEAELKDKELSESQATVKDLEEKLAAALEVAAKAQEELDAMKEAAMIAERVSILKENDILRSGEDKLVAQAERISKMSIEEFEAYVEDLTDIKERISTTSKAHEEEAKEEEIDSKVDEIVQGDAEAAASAEEVTEKLKKILSNEKLLETEEEEAPKTETEKQEDEKLAEETEEEKSLEESEEVKEEASCNSSKLDARKLVNDLVNCF